MQSLKFTVRCNRYQNLFMEAGYERADLSLPAEQRGSQSLFLTAGRGESSPNRDPHLSRKCNHCPFPDQSSEGAGVSMVGAGAVFLLFRLMYLPLESPGLPTSQSQQDPSRGNFTKVKSTK